MPAELRLRDALGQFLGHHCNLVLAAMTAAVGVAGLALAGPAGVPAFAAWAAVGLALWPVLEYVTHRWILHAPPLPWAWAVAMQRRLHYDHHVDPKRFDLLFAPLWFTIPAPLLLGAAYAALLPAPAAAAGLLFGNLATMLAYEWVHFLVHVPYQPRSAAFRRLKTLHTLHHYKNERYWFGVTGSTLDRLAGTHPAAEAVPVSPTVRAIHGDLAGRDL